MGGLQRNNTTVQSIKQMPFSAILSFEVHFTTNESLDRTSAFGAWSFKLSWHVVYIPRSALSINCYADPQTFFF